MRLGGGGVDGWLVWLCASRVFTSSIFMTYAACLPVLRREWDMSATAAGSVATGFQLGYAVSLMVFSELADRIGARRVFLVSGVLSALASLAFALLARSYVSALVLYTLVAVSLGGTYTTAIMLVADRYPTERRGAAVGWLIASSSLGYALSLGAAGAMLAVGTYVLAFVATALGPALGLATAWWCLRGTPNVVHPRAGGVRFVSEVMRNARAMRLIVGYTFHSWELLGMWAWVPAFLTASFVATGGRAVERGAYLSAAFHVVGMLASFSMGRLSDRFGRRTMLLSLAAISTACSFAFGWLLTAPGWVLVTVGAVYAFTALGDSPVLSTALTESVRPAYLGAALAFRSLVGFGAGAIAPLVFGAVLDATNASGTTPTQWGWAFVSLGLGGAIATWCAWTLATSPARRDAAAVS